MDEAYVRTSLRHALRVRRYHVWPMLQQQSVGEHTAQMLGIWCCLWGPPSPAATWALLWHDAGEVDAGDCQYGAKRRYPALKAALDEAEAATVDALVVTNVDDRIDWSRCSPPTQEEALRLKAVDLLDGWEHALTDVAMGNRMAVPVVDAYAEGLRQHLPRMSAEDQSRIAHWKRRSEYLRELRSVWEKHS